MVLAMPARLFTSQYAVPTARQHCKLLPRPAVKSDLKVCYHRVFIPVDMKQYAL
jgi:hypothetical protein